MIQNFSLLSAKTCNYNRILPENLVEKLPWPSPQHAQDCLGCSSAVTEEGERVPEAGAACWWCLLLCSWTTCCSRWWV